MSTGKIILLIIGILFVLISLPFLFGGGAVLVVSTALTNDQGYIMSSTQRLDSNTYAIVTEAANIELDGEGTWGWGWYWDWQVEGLVTFKVDGENRNSEKGIFLGIAEERYLETYLYNVEYDEITNVSFDPFKVDYKHHTGNLEPEDPRDVTFWDVNVYGKGMQTLEWEPETGTYALVFMNEDGSKDMDVDVAVGAKIPWLFGLGLALVIGGLLALIVGILMIIFSLRGRNKNQSLEPTQPMHTLKEV